MFGKLFGKKPASTSATGHPGAQALSHAIRERRKKDPLVGAKLGGKEVAHQLQAMVKRDGRIHIETLLACVGALGGFACHMAIRESVVDGGELAEKEAFVIADGTDGKRYFFGDLVNKPLAEDRLSLWTLVGGMAQQLDSGNVPDVQAIFRHVASSVGDEAFGAPNLPAEHMPAAAPIELLRALWPRLLPIVDKFCESPVERPLLFGFCGQEVLQLGKEVIAPGMAARVIMECAVPMSKISPQWLSE